MAELRRPDAPRWDPDKAFRLYGLGTPFPRAITFGDLDSEIEINSHFLVIEGKREHEGLSTGQRRAMDARVRDGRTVIIIHGDPPTDLRYIMQWPDGEKMPATWAIFWTECRRWAAWAESQPRPVGRPCPFRIDGTLRAAVQARAKAGAPA